MEGHRDLVIGLNDRCLCVEVYFEGPFLFHTCFLNNNNNNSKQCYFCMFINKLLYRGVFKTLCHKFRISSNHYATGAFGSKDSGIRQNCSRISQGTRVEKSLDCFTNDSSMFEVYFII